MRHFFNFSKCKFSFARLSIWDIDHKSIKYKLNWIHADILWWCDLSIKNNKTKSIIHGRNVLNLQFFCNITYFLNFNNLVIYLPLYFEYISHINRRCIYLVSLLYQYLYQIWLKLDRKCDFQRIYDVLKKVILLLWDPHRIQIHKHIETLLIYWFLIKL